MKTATIPTCEATGPDGTRLVIHPHAPTDSVADLASALDLPASTPLAIDGRPVAHHERLDATGLRVGSTVTVPAPAPQPSARPVPMLPTPSEASPGAEVAVAVGPSCERWMTLPPGRHSIGRSASAAIRVDDPAVELHHGVLDVHTSGSVAFTQLTGAFPATADGKPCHPGHLIGRGGAISLGSSRLLIGRLIDPARTRPVGGGSVVRADSDPWRDVVRRGPPAPGEPIIETLDVPEPPTEHRSPPLTSLVGAGIAATGAGLLAAVLGQMLFAVFAAVGASASVGTWAVGALVARRERRRATTRHRDALAAFEQSLLGAHRDAEVAHRCRHHSVVDALEATHGDRNRLWSRRCGRADVLWTTIGRGTCRWAPPIAPEARSRLHADLVVTLDRCERLDDAAVPLGLEPSSVVAFHGSEQITAALCRSVIVQLAATYGPADWELQVITNHPDRWNWISWLPQTHDRRCLVDAADGAALADALERIDADADTDTDPTSARRSVIVIDAPALLSTRTGPVRRRLERGDASCIALVETDASVPAIVNRVLDVGDTGRARWIETGESAWAPLDREIVIAGVSTRTAEAAARRLAPLLDPEDHDDDGAGPTCVSLAELEPVDDDAATVIARRWLLAGCDPAPVARLGRSVDGIVDVDLVRDGPHGLVAGTTGSGKSELLRTLVVSLAAHAGPDHVTMILVDYKGGSTFDACARLPHTVGVVTDLDDGLAERVLVSLDAEVRRRERLLRAARVDDLAAYRRTADEPLPRLVVVIDEFASLAKELPDFLGALVSIAQRGRSLGIHLLLATQRPAGVVTDDIRANTNLRIALRLQDRADAEDVVASGAPACFPAGAPGRAVLRLGPNEQVMFQTASTALPLSMRAGRLRVEPIDATPPGGPSEEALRVDEPTVLGRLVTAICEAAVMVSSASPHRPWIDALPDLVQPRDLGQDRTAVGMLDDPGDQCRRPLAWQPSDGTLLLIGAVGAGTTTAAAAVAAACARTAPHGSLHLYVIDAQGDTTWTPFDTLAVCGAVVRVAETERLARLLARLTDDIDSRANDARREPTIVVVIDGLAAARDALDDTAPGETAMRLDRVLRDGPAVGIIGVVTTDGSSPAGLAVTRSATWVFHVTDRGAARAVGLRAPAVGPGRPGRLRVVESGLEGQIVFDTDPLCGAAPAEPVDPDDGARPNPAPIVVLPEIVDADALDARHERSISPRRRADEPIELLVGLGADDLEPAVVRLPVGDHVFIGGASRTGRSTALRQVEAAWCRTHPDGVVLRIGRRHPLPTGFHTDTPDTPDHADTAPPMLVVVDDAERIDDPDGRLARLMTTAGITFAVAARVEAVRVAYGHWTREVARSRCGLIMTSLGDIDGELLGATLPRRSAVAPRPGLAWMIDQNGHRLVQVAARMPP